ncbi:cell surface protein [Tenacibaculum sp. IB213877]|uniref:tetratricopeptide repeat protein n=1 Tax=Tenacibaculum sp. IB213877 TaxID=3097351 RepID=UPI002A59A83C|nr:cell surface protein [Tenacibaculum sp. IB213877]MDY0779781.1 cell surface protein [Tenacibaculum sp. IB213877]
MKSLHILMVLCFKFLLLSCNTSSEEKITNPKDYNLYLVDHLDIDYTKLKVDLSFWQDKLYRTPNQYPYLAKIANANTALFTTTGEVKYLIEAEQTIKELNKKTNYNNCSNLRSLARNYISQHKFKQALSLLLKANEIGENISSTHKMLFDVYLELGAYDKAENYLHKIQNFSDFDYLIRASKWNDHLGDLKNAIRLMEKATGIAEASKNKNLMIWSYTNLADFYGHNNNVKKSYQYYLKALELDSQNAYAKKGIAWIVYSYEKDSKEALRILNEVLKSHKSPDYFLLKAEIEEYTGNSKNKIDNIQIFLDETNNMLYGDMYNQYNIQLFLDDLNKHDKALEIIEKEIKNRPTPISYDLLAWAYYKEKSYNKALQVAKKFVIGKTSEPQVIYHLAKIYKANKLNEEALKLKENLLESSYELGPLMVEKIKTI